MRMYISAPSPYEYLLLLIADDFFIFQGDCSSLAQKISGTELHVSPRRETHRLPQLDNLLSGFQDLRQSRTGGFLQHEGCASESCVPVQGSRWRSELFIQVEAWHHWQRYQPCKQRTSSSNFFLELLPRGGRGSFGIRTHLHSQHRQFRRPVGGPTRSHWQRGRRRCCSTGCRCRPPQWPRGGQRLRHASCCLGSDAGWFPKNKGYPDDLKRPQLPHMAGEATASMAKQRRHRRRRMCSWSGHCRADVQ